MKHHKPKYFCQQKPLWPFLGSYLKKYKGFSNNSDFYLSFNLIFKNFKKCSEMSCITTTNGINIIFFHQIIILDHSKTFRSKIVQQMFNPILGRGGHYGPDDRERPRCFRRVRAKTTKIHDFVSVYVWMVPWKSFLGFVFKIFEKRKKNFLMISKSKGPPFQKKNEKIPKKISFLKK